MGKFTVTHEIACDVDTFWKTFFDPAYNEKQFLEALQFPAFKITDQKENDREIIRTVAAQPKMNVPGAIAKLMGPNFRYVEEGRFDKATKVWSWKLIPSVLADKVRQEGKLRVEPLGENRVRRVADLTIEAKIFGLGGLIESSTEKQLRDGWDESARFTNKYLATPR